MASSIGPAPIAPSGRSLFNANFLLSFHVGVHSLQGLAPCRKGGNCVRDVTSPLGTDHTCASVAMLSQMHQSTRLAAITVPLARQATRATQVPALCHNHNIVRSSLSLIDNMLAMYSALLGTEHGMDGASLCVWFGRLNYAKP